MHAASVGPRRDAPGGHSERRTAGRRRRLLIAGISGLLALWGSLGPVPVRAEVIDFIVATIDGEPITRSALEQYVRERGETTASMRAALPVLITERLVEKEASARGIKVRSEDVDAYLDRVKTQRGLDDAALERVLGEQGLTVERYRKEIRAELEKNELINREIRGRVNVSPEEVRRHYEAHADDYSMAERVRLRMILIPVPPDAPPADLAAAEALVQMLHVRLQAGDDFAELARRYSRGPGASEGGDLGVFERGQMVPAVEEVAFRLKAGAVSTPIRSPGGFHLLKVEEREGSVERPFEAVAEQVREELYQAALQRRYERWLRDDLREAHHVEILWGGDEPGNIP